MCGEVGEWYEERERERERGRKRGIRGEEVNERGVSHDQWHRGSCPARSPVTQCNARPVGITSHYYITLHHSLLLIPLKQPLPCTKLVNSVVSSLKVDECGRQCTERDRLLPRYTGKPSMGKNYRVSVTSTNFTFCRSLVSQ